MRRKWVALVVAVLMIVSALPTAALAAGPTVRQVFRELVQVSLNPKYVTINTSTEYPAGHDVAGGTVSDNRNILSTLKSQGSWTFTPHENDGYDFTGWTGLSGPGGAFSQSGNNLTVSYVNNSNYNATANFNFVGFTVTLNLGDGATFNSNGSSTITLTGVQYGTLSVPAYTVKDGYDLKGWNGSLNIDSSRTLTANYEYEVNFVGNDHVTITGTTPVWTVSHDVTAPSYSVDAGYRFDGWNKSLNNLTGPTTITAKAAVRQYRLTLGISGEGSFWNRSAVEGTYDAGDEVRLSNAVPVGDLFWAFTRWLDPDTGQTYPLLTEVTLTRDCTYIAIFESLDSRYVNAYAQGPNGKLNHNINGTYARGTQINLNTAQPTAVTPGYEFKYWEEYIESSDSWIPVALTGGEPIATVGVVNDYRAIFGIEDYSITYNLNGGTDPGNPATYNINTQTFTLTNPTKTGYDFAGWTGTGLTGPTTTVTIAQGSTGDRSYTATWTAKTYNLTYNLDGGTDPGNPATYNIETPDFTLKNPTKDGYTFAGWTSDDITVPTTTVTIAQGSTGDRTFTANWTLKSYTITYNLNGGTDPGNPATYTINTPTFQLQDPTKNGYTFDGWTWSGQLTPTKDVEIPQGSTGDREYTANWTAKTYTLTYNFDGGTDPGNPATYNIESASFTLLNPTKDGYTFAGWTWAGQTTPTTTVTIAQGSTGDRTFTANWTLKSYTITCNLDGGTDPGNPATYTIESASFTLLHPTKDGYTFEGWTSPGNPVPDKTVTIPHGSTGDREYTAKWTAKDQPYRVNYIAYKDRTRTDSELILSALHNGKTDQVIDTTAYMFDAAGYDETVDPPATLTLGTDPAKNVINVYYTPQRQTYVVRYYLDGTTDPVAPAKQGTGVTNQTITEDPIDIDGYDPVSTASQSIDLIPSEVGDNVIIFYYTETEIIVPTAPPAGPVSPAPTVPPAGAGAAGTTETAAPTETPQPTQTPQPTEIVPEETVPGAPVQTNGGNSLDWLWILMGLILAGGFIFLFFLWKRRKREEEEEKGEG